MKNETSKDLSKEFLLEFFKESKIKDERGVLTITEVPSDFEAFVGKKSPYKFVFDIDTHNNVKDSELIMQGSYFMLAIRDYLGNKGQTSLLKIKIEPELKELVNNPNLKSYKILKMDSDRFDFLSEFSFLSIYQYLNDKKQATNRILVKNKDILDLDLNKFKIHNGNKDDILEIDLTEEYKTAKRRLDLKVDRETRQIKTSLKVKLEKELFRIKDHYFKQIKEKDEEVETCANKIKMLQSKLKHTTYDRDISILKRMIRESQARLEWLKERSYKERLKAEEIFHINDEVEKHVLSIKNNLINVTLYYYPIYRIEVSSKGKKLVIRYDPILDKIVS